MSRLLISFLSALITFCSCVSAQTLQYTVNLQKYGCPLKTFKPFTWESELPAETQHIAFDGAGKVYVGCAIQGEAKLLKKGEGSNIFHVLTIEPESGAVSRQLDFATQSKARTGVNLSENDALLVTANSKVQLVGEDGSIKASFDIPIDNDKDFLLYLVESTSDKTLLVLIDGLSGDSSFFLHADTLSPIAHCNIPINKDGRYREWPGTFSDNVKMFQHGGKYIKGGLIPPLKMEIGPLCGEAEDLWTLSTDIREFLLDVSTVLLIGEPKPKLLDASTIEIRKIHGGIVWSQNFPKHFGAQRYAGATRDGSRFAVEVEEARGGHPELDIGSKTISRWVWFFDARTGKRLGAIQVPTGRQSEYALSPNGDRFAILSPDGATLQVWKL